MSRINRTPVAQRRRIALSFGTAAGAACVAALVSMGTAPVAGAIVDADPLSDLVGALDPSAFTALGAPDDALGLLAAGLDTNLLAPLGLGNLLDPLIDDLVGTGALGGAATSVVDADPLSDLIGALDPSAFTALGAPDDFLGVLAAGLDTNLLDPLGLGALLDPVIDNLVGTGTLAGAAVVGDADPVSDLVAALDPNAFTALGAPDDFLGVLAAGLDADLLAPLGLGTVLDPVIDNLVGMGSLF